MTWFTDELDPAGNATIFNGQQKGSLNYGKLLKFSDNAGAGAATITNGGQTNFYDTSTASNATLTNNSSSSSASF